MRNKMVKYIATVVVFVFFMELQSSFPIVLIFSESLKGEMLRVVQK